ncbi:M17 family peptidase N-terminal domain-containing protein [Sphingomonas sp. NFR15]|uniref:M17 family peptidase N-terminal domain-containing protein n=1 Tax=Sphingomonas sp. NFR15 TaxID=1566282 RepID=UPI000888E95A|nr:M17 family peptidase N-terminal domain-containing protein [Sphingomonas sp. NFR15]SDA35719.1 Cytosol aminopeptidase family, N-terminal domain [Sphingomonas sp. NFR15]
MTQRQIVGTLHGVAIEVAAWDGSAAQVDLSCACMFEAELGGGPPTGGLAHLDHALSGTLLWLRGEGIFHANVGETLYIDQPPATVAARALLILGMGSPIGWSASALSSAVRLAVSTALALGASSGALAPSMLDSGLEPDQTSGAPKAMVAGLAAALDAQARLQAIGLVQRTSLSSWSFDVGAPRFSHAVAAFSAAVADH